MVGVAGRRRVGTAPFRSIDADFVSPEDLILMKLAWAVESGSERQMRDVEGIVAIASNLDREYLDMWAARLNIADAWERVLSEDPET